VLITVDPEHLAPEAMQEIQYVMALGNKADHTIEAFCKKLGEPPPARFEQIPERGQALFWDRRTRQLRLVSTIEPCRDRQRHRRKYAEGNSAKARAFTFADRTRPSIYGRRTSFCLCCWPRVWTTEPGHTILRAGDYSRWLREQVQGRRARGRGFQHRAR